MLLAGQERWFCLFVCLFIFMMSSFSHPVHKEGGNTDSKDSVGCCLC